MSTKDSKFRFSRRRVLLGTGGATALLAVGAGDLLRTRTGLSGSLFSDADLEELARRMSTVFPARVTPDRTGSVMVRWFDGDRQIGQAAFGPIADGNTLIISVLGFKESYRRRGIMTAALVESRDWLRAHGIERLRAPLTLDSTREIFARRGFEKTGDGDVIERAV